MRIAYAMINCNRSDGSARALVEVAERLAKRHEVHLFARTVRNMDTTGIQWHRVPGPGWPEVADFISYFLLGKFLLARGSFDIVHSVGCNVAGADVYTIQNIQPAKRRHLTKFASSERISMARRFTRWLYLKTTSSAEHVAYSHRSGQQNRLFLPVSAGVADELRQYYNIGAASVEVIPNAADIRKFTPCAPEDRAALRLRLGLPQNVTLFVFVGGEWARKGLDLAIKSMVLWRSHDAQLVILGDDPDRKRFESLAQSEGVDRRVVFAGFCSPVEDWMRACDAMLFPSWYEAFSLATIEAASCRLPLIATRINGTEDFVEPGVTGLFCEPDPASIAAAVNALMAEPDLCLRMGTNAREKVEANYTWDRIADMTESAYRRLLSRRKS